jgi:hypothetical protein
MREWNFNRIIYQQIVSVFYLPTSVLGTNAIKINKVANKPGLKDCISCMEGRSNETNK